MCVCVCLSSFITFGGPKPSFCLISGAVLLGPTNLMDILRVQTWLRLVEVRDRVVVRDSVVMVGVRGSMKEM